MKIGMTEWKKRLALSGLLCDAVYYRKRRNFSLGIIVEVNAALCVCVCVRACARAKRLLFENLFSGVQFRLYNIAARHARQKVFFDQLYVNNFSFYIRRKIFTRIKIILLKQRYFAL